MDVSRNSPSATAVIRAAVLVATGAVTTGKPAVRSPAGITTDAGTRATSLEDSSETDVSRSEAALRVTVPDALSPPTIDCGAIETSSTRDAGTTVTVADREDPP